MSVETSDDETLICARWLVPVEPQGQIIEHGALLIGDGRIVALGDAKRLRAAHPGARVVERPSHVLCPGLVNAHSHAAMSLLRGYADDLPRAAWRQQRIEPAEAKWVDETFVRDGTRLALCEMVRSGTTCINDAYFFPDISARVIADFGLRARIGIVVTTRASAWADNEADYLNKGLALRDEYRKHPLIGVTFAPSIETVSEATLVRIRSLADQLDEPVHVCLHETDAGIKASLNHHNARPLQRLATLGLVTPQLQAVHMNQVSDDDMRTLRDSGANVVHCPHTNLKLASGNAPLAAFVEHGINVALGSDSAAANNRLDMLGEMRTAALLGKGVAGDATRLGAAQILSMATLGGARALGWGDETGSLSVGKWADMVCLDLDHPATMPVYDPISALVYAAGRDQVSDVWVAGRELVSRGELIAVDERAIVQRARRYATHIAGK